MVLIESAQAHHDADKEYSSYFLIFGASFIVLLTVALAGQLLGWHWRTWLPGAEGVKSIFGGVKAGVYTFMSHIL